MTTQTMIEVRYAETDVMGIVHHSVYPIWFEAARTEFIRNTGFTYSQIEQRGILLPLIELNCRYKGYTKYEDIIYIDTSVKSFSPTRIALSYEIKKNNEKLIVTEGETFHVWTDKNLRPVNLRKKDEELYKIFEGLK